MRSPSFYHLSFLLPAGATCASRPIDLPMGCEIRVVAPLVKIRGLSRDCVFQAARNAVLAHWRDKPAVSIAAVLASPGACLGRDAWTIIVGADVAFAPTGLGATFPGREHAGLD
ncbi:hypothetical protein [Bradyrhizobium sp.]|uniref:hypothetical protein n=1 Tax=Bradyrhizobium sp. TaxID=376 RepID=UPI0039E50A68